jgi:hypothetical protein
MGDVGGRINSLWYIDQSFRPKIRKVSLTRTEMSEARRIGIMMRAAVEAL